MPHPEHALPFLDCEWGLTVLPALSGGPRIPELLSVLTTPLLLVSFVQGLLPHIHVFLTRLSLDQKQPPGVQSSPDLPHPILSAPELYRGHVPGFRECLPPVPQGQIT